MSIEADIKSALDAHNGLAALIGTRSYTERLPQQPTYPNIFFSRAVTEPNNTLTGRNNLTNARFQFEVRAEGVASKRNVITQLKDALETASFTALYIDEVTIPYADDAKVYRTDIDFSIWFIDS